MKRTRLLLLLCIPLFSVIALAHEFWLSPQKFFYTIREVANIRFLVGENFTGMNWTGNKDKIQQLHLVTPSGTITDLAPRLSTNKSDSLQLPLSEEGTHMVIFQSTNSFISLEAAKFNEYIQEDGLDFTAAYRKQHHEEEVKGTEYYQRSVKTIFQVGSKVTDDCREATSLPLDIIPGSNPYALPAEGTKNGFQKMKFRILFMGKPLPDVLVKIWYHPALNQIIMDTVRTNKKGWFTAERHPGPNMVSCVYMQPNQTDTIAQWQSYWSSLSFEYSQFFPRTGRNK